MNRPVPIIAMALLAWLTSGPVSRAEHLPITAFGTEQGLASDQVRAAVADRQGFIWFGTSLGLSRFDGHEFRSFGAERGLEHPSIYDLLAEEDGSLLVGTNGGLFRFDPREGGSFIRIRSDVSTQNFRVYLLRTRDGTIWAGANGLYRLENDTLGPILRRVSLPHPGIDTEILDLLETHDGRLLIASKGLYQVGPDLKPTLVCAGPWRESPWVTSVVEDGAHRIWGSTHHGPMIVENHVDAEGDISARCEPLDVQDLGWVEGRLLSGRGDSVWASCHQGILELDATAGVVRTVTRAQGLPDRYGAPLLIDAGGNLWIGNDVAGVARLSAAGFTSFGAAEGLEETRSAGLIQTRRGELVYFGSEHVMHRFDGTRFHAIPIRLPEEIHDRGWGWRQFQLEDHEGDWWIGTGDGIVRFAAVKNLDALAKATPRAVYTEADGLPSRKIFRLFEDSRGDVWVGMFWPNTSAVQTETLARWERSTNRFHRYGKIHGVTQMGAPTAFLEDADGSLWIGFYGGDVYRYRDGVFQRLFTGGEGTKASLIGAIYRDHRGRIWITTADQGVLRVDDPKAQEPVFVRLTTNDGLTTNLIDDVTEDDRGRIYLATDQGVDVLEGDRMIRQLGTADGLPARQTVLARSGPGQGVWFGTINGLARLDNANDYKMMPPPRVRIDGLKVSGLPRLISSLGETNISDLILSPDERRLQIDFMAVGGDPAGPVLFQYRLGADDAWSEPSTERTLLLPNLSPGGYRIEVRALNSGRRLSPDPAAVSFTVMAPVWQRPWFFGLVTMILIGSALAVYKARVTHLLMLERQRTRIAMDLHDELGSGLGSIGVLADLAASDSIEAGRRRVLLDQVASTASELGSSMSDIVSSLRPGAGTLESLARHLMERGRRMFPGPSPRLEVRVPETWPLVRLSQATRHNVALIGLEALHNAAQHAGARIVRLELESADHSRWRLSIIDDGKGLERNGSTGNGMGMESMRRRAESVGAELQLETHPPGGTTVSVLFYPEAKERHATRPGRLI